MKPIRLLAVTAVLSAVLLTACASSDTTKVTVYFSKNNQASLEQNKIPLIDNILNFFSTKAYAQSYTPGNTDYFYLWITADDIDGIYTPLIPGNQTSITVEVPSGSNRIFTLISFHAPEGSYYNYIGQKVTDLTGGETTIAIDMYPCVNNIQVAPGGNGGLAITWDYDYTLGSEYDNFSTITLYSACLGTDSQCDGSIISIDGSFTLDSSGTSDLSSFSSIVYPNTYYYFVRVESPNSPGQGITIPGNIYDFFSNYEYIGAYIMGAYSPPAL